MIFQGVAFDLGIGARIQAAWRSVLRLFAVRSACLDLLVVAEPKLVRKIPYNRDQPQCPTIRT